MSEKSELELYRETWSARFVVAFWMSIALGVCAFLLVVITVSIPNVIGVNHKIYLVSILGVALVCVLIGVIKSRNDSLSLLIWTKVNDIIAAGVVGLVIGQLAHH